MKGHRPQEQNRLIVSDVHQTNLKKDKNLTIIFNPLVSELCSAKNNANYRE